MDSRTFDRLVAEASRRPNRRTALRLFAGGLFGGLVAARGSAAHAQPADDLDNDSLIDADEVAVYGTNPQLSDTDGDGFRDGDEVYAGSNPLVPDTAIRTDLDGDGLFDDDESFVYGTDPLNPNTDGDGLRDGDEVSIGTNPLVPNEAAAPVEPTCLGVGSSCTDDAQCCAITRCCFDDVTISTRCTDVGLTDGFCPADLRPGSAPVGNAGGDSGQASSSACLGVGFYCDYDAQCCNGGAGVNCCFDSVSLRTRCEDTSARGACLEQ